MRNFLSVNVKSEFFFFCLQYFIFAGIEVVLLFLKFQFLKKILCLLFFNFSFLFIFQVVTNSYPSIFNFWGNVNMREGQLCIYMQGRLLPCFQTCTNLCSFIFKLTVDIKNFYTIFNLKQIFFHKEDKFYKFCVCISK